MKGLPPASKHVQQINRFDLLIFRLCAVFSAVLLLGLLPVALRRYGAEPGNARFFMGFFHVLVWVVLCGGLMARHRQVLCLSLGRWRSHPALALVLSSLSLACLEEAIACLATNLHGPFGDPTGRVYITASANLLDLIFFHSVVVIFPLLLAWAALLRRYAFSVSRFTLIFGAQGALAEVAFAGMQPALFPTWLLVYSLMVWIPYRAYFSAFDAQRERIPPGVVQQLAAPIMTQLAGILFTLVFLMISHGLLKHPLSHYP
ncbi:MAG: hypothetical protein U0931_28905 [Vulcanimicrobiota bacterium]